MNYSQQITIKGTAQNAFTALTQNLNLWWGKTDGPRAKTGDVFKVFFGKAFWQFKITESIPGSRITWECIDGWPDFEKEWIGTTLHWSIEPVEGQSTLVKFTHNGLTPEFDCYDVCAPTWDLVITGSLKQFVETGTGEPLSV